MIFEFVVHRLHWLSRVPFAPHLFDAFLLTSTAIFHPETIRAMELFERRVLELPDIKLCRHRFGGTGFVRSGDEFAHLHGNGLLDVRLTCEIAKAINADGLALPHHLFGPSAWVSFWIRSLDDLPNAMQLIRSAE